MANNDEYMMKCLKCGHTEPVKGGLQYCPKDDTLLTKTLGSKIRTENSRPFPSDRFDLGWRTLLDRLETPQTFLTIGERTSFSGRRVSNSTIEVTPLTTERPRPINKSHFQQVFREWQKSESYNPADYQHTTVNSVYILRLIKEIFADAEMPVNAEWFAYYLKLAKQDTEYYPEYLELLQQVQGKPFLTKEEFLQISRWKLKKAISRFKRHEQLLQKNSEKTIRDTTKAAFSASTERRSISLLEDLSGVRIPVASTIMTFHDPTRYAIFDMHAWRTLYDFNLIDNKRYRRDYGTTSSYAYYDVFITSIRNLATRFNLTPREVELVLFTYSRKK